MMKTLSSPLAIATFALSLGAVALFAQQNATLISVKLFGLTLLNLPLGLLLTFSAMTGLFLAILCQSWLTSRR